MAKSACWITVAGAALGLLCGAPAAAQTTQTGLHYYAVEDLDQKQIVQRGVAGANGVAFSNLILAPNTRYRIWILQARTLHVAKQNQTTPASGNTVTLGKFVLREAASLDADGDGLHDLGERIMGTNPKVKDSDGDGVNDGAEVVQGTNPLDGQVARTGVIGSVDTPGNAIDVCAQDDLVVVADGASGIQVHSAFNRLAPRIIARVDTPGNAQRVSCNGARVAVADGAAGLAIVDISDPPQARISHQVSGLTLGGQAISVVVVDRIAYVGTDTGKLVGVDVIGGGVVQRLNLPGGGVRDLAVDKDHLYALTEARLHSLSLGATLKIVGAVNAEPAFAPALRLAVGDGIAYVAHGGGYNTFDVRSPANLIKIASGTTQQSGWRQIRPNGSGQGIALAHRAAPSAGDGVSVYDTRDPQQTDVFVQSFVTPGEPLGVDLYNDLAYVADGSRGLQVVSYRFSDTGSVAPTISLSTNFGLTSIEEGKLARVTAAVGDDVAVRNVEWFIDGAKVATDGNFPFEHRFTAPTLASGRTSFTVRARATDTGGNATFSALLTIRLGADTTGPSVLQVAPLDGALVSSGVAGTVAALLSEPVAVASVTSATFTVTAAGPDGALGTADDVAITTGALGFRTAQNGIVLSFTGGLPQGRYRAQVGPGVTDAAGNPLASPLTWEFTVIDVGQDRDGDGVPDALEAALGLDPDDPDSDNDGLSDGLEDFDNDGLNNAAEVLLQRDARNPDTDMDGIADGAEDLDGDLLTDADELARGTDVLNWDTDGDRFSDGEEVLEGSDPRAASSLPLGVALGVVSLRNDGGLPQAAARIAVKNDGGLDSASSTTSVKNTAAPEAIDGRVEGPSFSTRNDGTPP